MTSPDPDGTGFGPGLGVYLPPASQGNISIEIDGTPQGVVQTIQSDPDADQSLYQLSTGNVVLSATCRSLNNVSSPPGQPYLAYVWVSTDFPQLTLPERAHYVYTIECNVVEPGVRLQGPADETLFEATSAPPPAPAISTVEILNRTPATPEPIFDDTFESTGVTNNLQIFNTGAGDLNYELSLTAPNGGITLLDGTSNPVSMLSGDIDGGAMGADTIPIRCGGAGNTFDPSAPNPLTATLTLQTDIDRADGTPDAPGPDQTTFTINCPITPTASFSSTPAPNNTFDITPSTNPDDWPRIGTFAENDLEIGNTGNAPLTVRDIMFMTTENVQFQVVNDNGQPITQLPPIAPSDQQGNTFGMTVRCTPTGPYDPANTVLEGTLEFEHNGNDAQPGEFVTETYTVACDQAPDAPNLVFSPNVLASPLDFGNVPLDGSSSQSVRIWNTGTSVATVTGVTLAEDPADPGEDIHFDLQFETLGTALNPTTPPGPPPDEANIFDITVTCDPEDGSNPGMRSAQVTVAFGGFGDRTFELECNTVTPGTGAGISVTVNPGTLSTQIGTETTSRVTIDNTAPSGGSDLGITSISLTDANNIFELLREDGVEFASGSVPGYLASITPDETPPFFDISCTPISTSPVVETLTISHSAGSNIVRDITCQGTNPDDPDPPTEEPPQPQPTGAVYSSNPQATSTIPMTTSVGGSTTASITITNTGASGALTITGASFDTGNQIGFTPEQQISNQIVLNPAQPTTITFTCSSTAGGTFSDTLTVSYTGASGSPARYNVNCTVGAETATPVQPTALPAAEAGQVTQCAQNTILSTPFPQNASGEFLFVNCFTITTARTVNISLTQVLTNLATEATPEEIESIRANPGLVSFWRMGSWFLVESQYNAATQTYTFQSASGSNIYGAFYGAITRPVGQQGNAAFAGTTTGNVDDPTEVRLDDENSQMPLAMIIATLVVLLVGAVFISRRRRVTEPNDI
ncbi:MAG: hypothetical protein ACLFTK_00915 [Anaerolineales bacterium]